MTTTVRRDAATIEAYKPEDRKKGRLTRQHYDVLRLDAAGKKYQEIADLLGLPLGTVRSAMHRGKAALNALVQANAPKGMDGEPEVAFK